MRFLRPRLRTPVRSALLGTAFAVLIGIGQGLGVALVLEGFVLVLAAAYYVWGGRDTDGGAIIGHRADERQKNMQMKVTALQGQVMTVAAAIAFVVAVVGKATLWPKANIWPYEVPALLAGLTGIVGWVIYRDRGEGDDAAAERAGEWYR